MLNVAVKVRGLKELERNLIKLGELPAREVGWAALKEGAKPIEAEAKRLVRVRTGLLRESIYSFRGGREGQTLTYNVGVRKGKKWAGWRAKFIEFGVPKRGVPAYPFMRPAADAMHEVSIRATAEELLRGIDAEMSKMSVASDG
jgi:HK97 gp10 family phage protein